MKTSSLRSWITRCTLGLALAWNAGADETTDQQLKDHVDSQLPAHFQIETLHLRLLGRPASKAKGEVVLRLGESLYVEITRLPDLSVVPTALTPDLRDRQPKPLKVLKVKSAADTLTRPVSFDFIITAGSNGPSYGPINPRLFASLGLPRTEFPAEALAEDTPEGRAAIAAWENSVTAYNEALDRLDGRVRQDRLKEVGRETITSGLEVFKQVRGGGAGQAAAKTVDSSSTKGGSLTNSPPQLAQQGLDLIRGLGSGR